MNIPTSEEEIEASWKALAQDRGKQIEELEKKMERMVLLLHQVDGHLGLAVHRNEHDERWKREASDYITRIRTLVKESK